MGWELETVEKPFVEQLLTMGWRYVEGDLDAPAATSRTSFTEVIQEATLRRQLHALNLDATASPGSTTSACRRPSAPSPASPPTG